MVNAVSPRFPLPCLNTERVGVPRITRCLQFWVLRTWSLETLRLRNLDLEITENQRLETAMDITGRNVRGWGRTHILLTARHAGR
jgi:hypothetical protein